MNIKAVVQQCPTSDEAFKELYLGTIDKLFPFVLLRTKDRALALDICQEVYLDLWQQSSHFVYRSDEEFFGYLFLIARRKLYKARHRYRDNISLDEDYDLPDLTQSHHEDYRHLIKSLDVLKDRERSVIELRYFGEYTFGEIAHQLGISEGNAKVLHHRAIQTLQKHLLHYG
jgi:RNA polymerase sigma-70 factor (ECF subfamily)